MWEQFQQFVPVQLSPEYFTDCCINLHTKITHYIQGPHVYDLSWAPPIFSAGLCALLCSIATTIFDRTKHFQFAQCKNSRTLGGICSWELNFQQMTHKKSNQLPKCVGQRVDMKLPFNSTLGSIVVILNSPSPLVWSIYEPSIAVDRIKNILICCSCWTAIHIVVPMKSLIKLCNGPLM